MNNSMKYGLVSVLILAGCGSDSTPLQPNISISQSYSAEVSENADSATTVLTSSTSNNGYGTCTLSSDKKTVTYTLNDPNYTGQDRCEIVWNGCDQQFDIDFSLPSRQLIGVGGNCT